MTRRRVKPTKSEKPHIRCAIYTRKSTTQNLDSDFNTLDAQREAGEAFIASQQHEGWQCLPQHYDDGGYTGGNMDRPALRRLMADIQAGKIDCVVVYKVDRLSRSLLDFAKMLEVFGGPLFFEVVVQKLFGNDTDWHRVEENKKNNIPPVLDYLETQLNTDQQYLVADQLTIADISVCSHFINAQYADYEVDATRWPKLAHYISQIMVEPVIAKRMAAEQAFMSQ